MFGVCISLYIFGNGFFCFNCYIYTTSVSRTPRSKDNKGRSWRCLLYRGFNVNNSKEYKRRCLYKNVVTEEKYQKHWNCWKVGDIVAASQAKSLCFMDIAVGNYKQTKYCWQFIVSFVKTDSFFDYKLFRFRTFK